MIKNGACYYLNNKININDVDLYNTSLDERLYENVVIFDDANSTWTRAFGCYFDKVERYIRKYDSLEYLALFHRKKILKELGILLR